MEPTNIENILKELKSSYSSEIDSFFLKYDKEINIFANLISLCYQEIKIFDKVDNPSKRLVFTKGYAFASFDNLYDSYRLLILGYLSASCNLFRQALEASCMAILISTNVDVSLGKLTFNFFEDFENKKKNTFPHKAIELVAENYKDLDVNKSAIEITKSVQKFLHKFSHPSQTSMIMRYLGKDGRRSIGGVEPIKSIPLDQHIESRNNFCRILPVMINTVFERAKITYRDRTPHY